MIINPSHEITLSGLPSEILDAYVRYKKGSRAIVAWLVQYGSDKYTHVKTLPIKELAFLAQRVSYKINEVPEVIHFYFRETISARRCLSRFFRSNVDESDGAIDTVNHEHFTNSLNQIYFELCERCRTADVKRLARKTGRRSSNISKTAHNHYEFLPIEDTNQGETLMAPPVPECIECKDASQKSCDVNGAYLQFEDDEVSTAVEMLILVERLRHVYAIIEECWNQAGRSHVSFIAAAGSTNIAWKRIRDIEARLQNLDPDISLLRMHRTCRLIENQAVAHQSAGQKSKYHNLLEKLELSERSLRHHLDGRQPNKTSTCAMCVQKPANYIQSSPSSPAQRRQDPFQVALLDNIVNLINQAGCAPALVFTCTPCFAEISHLLSTANAEKYLLESTLATHLLSTTYKAYISGLSIPSTISTCRITSLKMASQAASNISTLLSDKISFPCQCPQTLAYHLSNLQHDLESYAKHRRWDLYFQSPWIAGNHIIEMLDILSYYGMRLFHYRHYLGAVIHTYNVLQQLAGLEEIPLLEELCSTFGDMLFPGGRRPTSNFKNSWSRFVGARLRFKQGHSGHTHRESWCMAVPAHAARAAAGLSSNMERDRTDPKFDYGRVDLLMKLKQQHYRLGGEDDDGELFEREDCTSISQRHSSPAGTFRTKPQSTTEVGSTTLTRGMVSDTTTISPISSRHSQSEQEPNLKPNPNSLLSTLHQLNSSLTTKSSSSSNSHPLPQLPTTRLNLISIFSTFTRLISQISHSTHSSSSPSSPSSSSPQSSTPNQDSPPQNCICFVTLILQAADRITTGRQQQDLETSYWRKEEREVVDIVKRVLVEEIGLDKKREEWLWDLGC